DNAAQDVGSTFADRPAVEARLRMVIAYTYVGLGQYASADSHAVAAIQSLSRVPNPDLNEQTVGHSLLGQIRYFEGEYDDAEEEFERALAIEQSRDDIDVPSVALGLSNLAFLKMRRGQYEEARVKFSQALACADEGLGPDDATSLDILGNMAMLDLRMERYEEAETVYKDVIARYRRVRGDEHPQTILFIANLGVVYLRQERFAQAEALFREALAAQERVIGPTHSQTLITMGSLAGSLAGQGRTDEAMGIIEEGLRRSIETYGVDEPSTIYLKVAQGRVLELSDQPERAYAQVAQTLAEGKKVLGPESDVCFDVWKRLFRLQEALGKDEAHLTAATDLVNSLGSLVGENDDRVQIGHLEMGEAYRALGRFDESERQLLLVHETGDSTARATAAAGLSALYKDWDRPEDAARYALTGTDDAPVTEGVVD
ncbi:MAG: tetratricopeptide repeat protein, partial [Candidatus Eisenbacteria bacterium]|nr:tetratricopeptide repeat protein [Candidatus Eisenbacteria bacterium]